MADVLREDLFNKIVKSGKFSLMIDESTDISVRQNLVTYVRLLESDDFGNFDARTYFLSIDELDRANAEAIYTKVTAMLKQKGLDIQNLCSVSTDGASVMVGKNSGVVTRLKKQIPGILATHCIAHRLALSCAGGADTVPYLVKYQEILNSIYKFFQYSPKNMSTLLAIQKVIQSKTQKCKEVFHTRWLSFEGSVDALLTNYSSLVSVFLEQTSGKALSLYKPITCYKFLHVSHFLADCLGPLAILSKTFQKQDLSFSEIHPLLTATIDTLAEIKDGKAGDSLSDFIAQVPAEPTTDSDGLCTFEYQGHTIRDGAHQRTAAAEVCKKFVENMLASLNERFSDNADSAILTALTNFFNPELHDSEINEHFDALIDYSETLGLEGTKHELRAYSKFCRTSYESGNKSVKNIKSACNLAIRNKNIYPFCAELASRLLVAPVATADCERGFSKQNLIKTHLRNSLKIQNLNNLMTLAIDGPAVEHFDFKSAFGKWAGLKSRRILN